MVRRTLERIGAFAPLAGLVLAGGALAGVVYLDPSVLYATAVVVAAACVCLFAAALLVRRRPLRAEPPSLADVVRWADEADGPRGVRGLLRRLGRWPHLLDDLPTSLAERIRVRVREAGGHADVRDWIEGDRRQRRVGAIHLAGWLPLDDAEGVLARVLEDEETESAYAAAASLMRLDRSSALDRLVRALGRGRLPDSRVVALLETAPTDLLVDLVARWSESDDASVRAWLAHLAGHLPDDEALPLLLAFSRDPVLDVRANAAEALGARGEAARHRLEELLADPSWVVRAHAAEALGRLGPLPSLERLALLLSHTQRWVRERALRALDAAGLPSRDPDDPAQARPESSAEPEPAVAAR